MVASHQDFRESFESARSPCLIELTQNQWIASSKLGEEDPEMEIAFPYAGDLEASRGPTGACYKGSRSHKGEGPKNSTLEYNTHG